MMNQDMRQYAEGQVAFWTKQIAFDKGQIEWTNRQLERTRKEDREQKEWAKTYNNGEYAHLYEGRYQGKETKKLLNERRRWQRDLKNAEKELAHYQKLVDENTEPKAEEPENKKEEDTMGTTLFEVIKAAAPTATEETIKKIASRILEQYGENVTEEQATKATIEIMKEETTMKTTFTTLNGTTYTMNPQTNRYAKTVDGKTTRIGKAEYEKAQHEYELEQEVENLELHPVDEQAELDKEPCRVEVENDLDKPAVLDEHGCVDCRKCNCDKCVHRNCMRRNPRNVGGNGECPRLDNGIMGEGQKIAEEEGIEPAEAELEANIRNEQKKPRKARKSKDIAYEGHGKTLTAKQVDFILHLSDTCFWENGLESTPWIDCLCDEIGGQFANKPMTVGAMVSTLCEKGLGYRATDSLTDMATGRSHKATYFALTDLGKEIAAELGLE